MKRLALAFVLLIPSVASTQVELPATVKAKTCKITPIVIKNVPPKVTWTIIPPEGAEPDVFREFDADPKVIRLRFHAEQSGVYHLIVASSNGEVKLQVCVITVDGTGPPQPPADPPSKLVKHLTFAGPTQATAGVVNDAALRRYLAEIGVKVHVVTTDIAPKMKQAIDAAGGTPAVVLQDIEGNILAIERMTTADAAKKLVQGYLK